MEFRQSEISFYRHIFEDLIKNVYRIGDNYYLQNASQIFYEILMSFSRIHNLTCLSTFNPEFVKSFESIYQGYTWILKRINPQTSQFTIPSIPQFTKIIKRLLKAISNIA